MQTFPNEHTQPEPSPEFLQCAQDIAWIFGVDPQHAIDGAPLVHQGLTFSLRQHGTLDPSGLVLAIEISPLIDGLEARQCKNLLRQHLRMPPMFAGYYALAPQRDVIVYCLRVDLEKDEHPAQLVRAFVKKTIEQREEVGRMLDAELQGDGGMDDLMAA